MGRADILKHAVPRTAAPHAQVVRGRRRVRTSIRRIHVGAPLPHIARHNVKREITNNGAPITDHQKKKRLPLCAHAGL